VQVQVLKLIKMMIFGVYLLAEPKKKSMTLGGSAILDLSADLNPYKQGTYSASKSNLSIYICIQNHHHPPFATSYLSHLQTIFLQSSNDDSVSSFGNSKPAAPSTASKGVRKSVRETDASIGALGKTKQAEYL
jgi:hypothetical protein